MKKAQRIHPSALACLSLLGFAAGQAPAADQAGIATQEVSPVLVVDTLERNAGGVHPGFRRNHSKGVCALGSFTATQEAATLSRSPIFSGRALPVVARFSVAGGRPKMPDTARNPRGMALKLILPDGSAHMMAMIHTPLFGVSTPAAFLANLQANAPDPATGKPNPAAIQAFAAAHPESHAQGEFLKTHNPPASYASTPYFSLHAFRFINAAGQGRFVRWRFEPQDGTAYLEDETLAAAPADFLETRLQERMQKGPARWNMIVTLAEAGDALTDPTVAWPAGRQEVRVGVLELVKAEPQAGGSCDKVNFDPLVLSDGVEPSDDPVLRFRSPAYAVSFGRRTSDSATK